MEELDETSGSEDGLYATLVLIWGTISALILLLTLYEGILSRKEIYVKLILGESPNYSFFKSSLLDIFVYCIVFISSACVFALFSPVLYKIKFISIIFIGMIFANTAILFFCTRLSRKKSIAKNIENNKLILISYILKCLCTLLACSVLAANTVVISEAMNYFSQESFFEEINNYSNYEIRLRTDPTLSDNPEQINDAKIWYQFDQSFGEGSIWMVDVSGLYNHNAVLINEKGVSLMEDYLSEDLLNQLECLERDHLSVFIPSEINSKQDLNNILEMTSAAFLTKRPADELAVKTYHGQAKVLGINRKTSLYGSRFLRNPIIIIDTRSSAEIGPYPNAMYTGTEVLYQINEQDLNTFLANNNLDASNSIVRVTNATSAYQYFLSSVSKSLKLISAVTLFIFLLEVLMIFFLIRLEYLVNGMAIAIKKTLGYSRLARVNTLVLITFISISISILGAGYISYLTNLGEFFYIAFWGSILLLIELCFISLETRRLDKLQTCLILKGAHL